MLLTEAKRKALEKLEDEARSLDVEAFLEQPNNLDNDRVEEVEHVQRQA